jgi:muramoyltetrapeptide carboxypeptidase LdcA involved in peptidoglycan recycling
MQVSHLLLTNSRLVNNSAEDDGALYCGFSDVTLLGNVFFRNGGSGSFVDIVIQDDKDPALGGSYVLCAKRFTTNFCNGLDGVFTSTEGGSNTNCRFDGISDSTSPACSF